MVSMLKHTADYQLLTNTSLTAIVQAVPKPIRNLGSKKFIAIIGKGAVGKSRLAAGLCQNLPGARIFPLAMSRQARPDELMTQTIISMEIEQYNERLQMGEFLVGYQVIRQPSAVQPAIKFTGILISKIVELILDARHIVLPIMAPALFFFRAAFPETRCIVVDTDAASHSRFQRQRDLDPEDSRDRNIYGFIGPPAIEIRRSRRILNSYGALEQAVIEAVAYIQQDN